MANIMSCDLPDVEIIGNPEESCNENYAGIGRILYAIDSTWLKQKPEYDLGKGRVRYQSWCFGKSNFKAGKMAIALKGKKNVSKNTGTGNEGASKGAAQQLTFTVENDIEVAAAVLRQIKNKGDFYWLCEKSPGEFQVVGDPTWGSDCNTNYDSGDQPTSDSGLAVTVSCPNAPSPVMYWYEDDDDKMPATDNEIRANGAALDYAALRSVIHSAEDLSSTIADSSKKNALDGAIVVAKNAIKSATKESDITSAVAALKTAIATALA